MLVIHPSIQSIISFRFAVKWRNVRHPVVDCLSQGLCLFFWYRNDTTGRISTLNEIWATLKGSGCDTCLFFFLLSAFKCFMGRGFHSRENQSIYSNEHGKSYIHKCTSLKFNQVVEGRKKNQAYMMIYCTPCSWNTSALLWMNIWMNRRSV